LLQKFYVVFGKFYKSAKLLVLDFKHFKSS